MSRQKTKAEYEATALLLGMIYDEQINTFYRTNGDHKAGMIGTITDECDADTMKPLSEEEVSQRYADNLKLEPIVSADYWDHGDGE